MADGINYTGDLPRYVLDHLFGYVLDHLFGREGRRGREAGS